VLLPSQITIDISSLPAQVRALITSIDTFITSWTLNETEKVYVIDLTTAAPAVPLETKRQAIQKIIEAYRKFGWDVDHDFTRPPSQNEIAIKFRLRT